MESNWRWVLGGKKQSYLPLGHSHLCRSSHVPRTGPGIRDTVNSQTHLVLVITELTVEWERTDVEQIVIQVNLSLHKECFGRERQATYFV